MKKFFLGLVLSCFYLCSNAFAEQIELEIPINGYEFRNYQMNLKDEIAYFHPNTDISDSELVSIYLGAKSPFGDSEVYVTVDRNSASPVVVPGNLNQYEPQGYYYGVSPIVPFSSFQDKWYLTFIDRVKVDKIYITIDLPEQTNIKERLVRYISYNGIDRVATTVTDPTNYRIEASMGYVLVDSVTWCASSVWM